ncbi:Lrp/AsnC family transcriptional regulator [Brachybacterium sp.]|uniref:Lrp/AsnC family transcriptional regulator n=1 Tax=Brachybacterium sp. TaxID=1891286 RepID=UPI002ED2819F
MLDDLDYRLIALLRSDSRTPVAVLARELGINRSTVTSRIDRLVGNGVIEGFTIRVSGDLEHDSVQGVMLVATENRRSHEIVHELRGYPELEQLHSTTGNWDLVLQIRTKNLSEFDLVLERVRAIPGVSSTQTNLLFSSLRTA